MQKKLNKTLRIGIYLFAGAIGTNVLPKAYFGIPERFSVFAATGFNAVLGVYLFHGFRNMC